MLLQSSINGKVENNTEEGDMKRTEKSSTALMPKRIRYGTTSPSEIMLFRKGINTASSSTGLSPSISSQVETNPLTI